MNAYMIERKGLSDFMFFSWTPWSNQPLKSVQNWSYSLNYKLEYEFSNDIDVYFFRRLSTPCIELQVINQTCIVHTKRLWI